MATDPLPQEEFEVIFSKVPRLTVEVVLLSTAGVLLARRELGPCAGLWSLPGGTVRYGERLVDAVSRIDRDELGCAVRVGQLLGYLEYPSHLARDIDWPIGIAFRCDLVDSQISAEQMTVAGARWFHELPPAMHDEQRAFLRSSGLPI